MNSQFQDSMFPQRQGNQAQQISQAKSFETLNDLNQIITQYIPSNNDQQMDEGSALGQQARELCQPIKYVRRFSSDLNALINLPENIENQVNQINQNADLVQTQSQPVMKGQDLITHQGHILDIAQHEKQDYLIETSAAKVGFQQSSSSASSLMTYSEMTESQNQNQENTHTSAFMATIVSKKGKRGIRREVPIHICIYCGQGFTRRNRLRLHQQTAHSDLPRVNYQCPFPHCGKIFSEKGNLKVHQRTHTGEKPYACQYCGKQFTSIGNKRDHERRHLQDKPYACQHCDKSYFRRYLLTQHMAVRHPEQQQQRFESLNESSSSKSGKSGSDDKIEDATIQQEIVTKFVFSQPPSQTTKSDIKMSDQESATFENGPIFEYNSNTLKIKIQMEHSDRQIAPTASTSKFPILQVAKSNIFGGAQQTLNIIESNNSSLQQHSEFAGNIFSPSVSQSQPHCLLPLSSECFPSFTFRNDSPSVVLTAPYQNVSNTDVMRQSYTAIGGASPQFLFSGNSSAQSPYNLFTGRMRFQQQIASPVFRAGQEPPQLQLNYLQSGSSQNTEFSSALMSIEQLEGCTQRGIECSNLSPSVRQLTLNGPRTQNNSRLSTFHPKNRTLTQFPSISNNEGNQFNSSNAPNAQGCNQPQFMETELLHQPATQAISQSQIQPYQNSSATTTTTTTYGYPQSLWGTQSGLTTQNSQEQVNYSNNNNLRDCSNFSNVNSPAAFFQQ